MVPVRRIVAVDEQGAHTFDEVDGVGHRAAKNQVLLQHLS